MAVVTRTLQPLPFQHLEPKRFEDLIRQLVYDFRVWRQLEPTGRGGSDDSFDVRGFEIAEFSERESASDAEENSGRDEEKIDDVVPDRIWLVQCKREREIGPAKLENYLNDIPANSLENLHGLIFAAACDFSKKAIDLFRGWCVSKRIQEFQLWGQATLEDFLYQPKNDHLLFAYFGISLQIRRQKVASTIRRTVALKRKLNRLISHDGFPGTPVLLRDLADERYPSTQGKTLEEGKFLWLPSCSRGIGEKGLKIVIRRHLAYYDLAEDRWDFASGVNYAAPEKNVNLWYLSQVPDDDRDARRGGVMSFWWDLPQEKQHHVFFIAHLPYEEIIEIDEVGDDRLKMPTVFVNFREHKPPLSKGLDVFFLPVKSFSSRVWLHSEGHIKIFPDQFRDAAWEETWFSRNGIPHAEELSDLKALKPGD